MKKLFFKLSVVAQVLFLSGIVFAQTQSGYLTFDQQSISANVGKPFDVNVVVDAGSEQISSIDAYVIYNPGLIEPRTITPAGFFPTVVNNITPGRIYIAGLVDDAANFKTGSGSVATITFMPLTIGTGTLIYDCQPGVYNSSKVIQNDLNATNIIDCSQSGVSEITIGEGTGGDTLSNNTATPSALPKTGIFENITKVAIPGVILLLLGGALRLVL